MTGENEWKPSRWTPPADLEEAFKEGRSTRRLPDGSTASLSWTPEMNDRWWSYDGALASLFDFNPTLGVLDESPRSPWIRSGNGIMLVPDSEIEELLSIADTMKPVGQPWSYNPLETGVLREPADSTTLISWIDLFPSILVSHDGRIAVVDWTYSTNFITEIIDTDEQCRFYVGRLFKILSKYLYHGSLVLKHKVVFNRSQLQSLEKWILSLPTWASIIIGARLADAGNTVLLNLCADVDSLYFDPFYLESINKFAAVVNNECSRLSVLSIEQIYDNNENNQSFDQLALEYGPCWLMQSLIALDHASFDSPASLDLVMGGDHWKTSIDRDLVLEACRLAGAMNAPIELWPRFYSILENRDQSRLDETTALTLLATPIKNWAALEKAESIASDHGELVRKACYLATAAMAKINDFCKMEDVQRAIVRSLDSDRPIAGQTVDLMMALDDIIDLQDCDHILKSFILDIPSLLKDKPDMTGTINGASLIASDLNRMNVNEN